MKKKNNMMVKALAIFALLGIIISIIGTALLVITSGGSGYEEIVDQQPTLTAEQLQEIISAQPETQVSASGAAQ